MLQINDAPSPQNQDGTVLSVAEEEEADGGVDLAAAVDMAEEAAAEEEEEPHEAPAEFMKAVGEQPASKQNPWD